jgi:hypothetical protein
MNINCKTAAIRSSRLRDQNLRGIKKLELWYHIAICRICRIYNRQIQKLGRISRLVGDASATGDKGKLRLSDEAKTRIKNNLQS